MSIKHPLNVHGTRDDEGQRVIQKVSVSSGIVGQVGEWIGPILFISTIGSNDGFEISDTTNVSGQECLADIIPSILVGVWHPCLRVARQPELPRWIVLVNRVASKLIANHHVDQRHIVNHRV